MAVYHAFNTFIRDAFDDLAEEEHHTFQRYRDRQDIIDVDEIVVRLERDWAEQCDHVSSDPARARLSANWM